MPSVPQTAPLKFLTEAETADVLQVAVATLRTWRCRGCGPRFSKIGRLVRYRPEEISRYVDRNTRG